MTSAPFIQYACFNTIFEIACSSGVAGADSGAGPAELIVFESAQYGRNDLAGALHCDVPVTRSCDIDVQYPLSRMCGGRRRCSLAVNTAFFGDPCGYEEFLKVAYRCVPESDIHRGCSDPSISFQTLRPDHSVTPYFEHGYMASPNYPGKHYIDAECEWTLRVQRNQSLIITLFDFELDVKHDGNCQDFLSVTSRNGSKFRDCGALGKQVIVVNDNVATISFKTSQTSLTQRGFILYFEGSGCQEIDSGSSNTVVRYYLDDVDVLHLNASCKGGYHPPSHIGNKTLQYLHTWQAVCTGTAWSDVIPDCIYSETTSFLAMTSLSSHVSDITWSSTSTSISDDLTSVSAVTGVALGIVFGFVLLSVGLLIVIVCNRRNIGKRKKQQWRMVVNNLQENVANDVTKYLRDDASFQTPVTSAKRQNNVNVCNHRSVEDVWVNRNLLEPSRSRLDAHDDSQPCSTREFHRGQCHQPLGAQNISTAYYDLQHLYLSNRGMYRGSASNVIGIQRLTTRDAPDTMTSLLKLSPEIIIGDEHSKGIVRPKKELMSYNRNICGDFHENVAIPICANNRVATGDRVFAVPTTACCTGPVDRRFNGGTGLREQSLTSRGLNVCYASAPCSLDSPLRTGSLIL